MASQDQALTWHLKDTLIAGLQQGIKILQAAKPGHFGARSILLQNPDNPFLGKL